MAHIRVNKPARRDEGIWQISQAIKANPRPVVAKLLDAFDVTAQAMQEPYQIFVGQNGLLDGPLGGRGGEVAEWEGKDAAGPSL